MHRLISADPAVPLRGPSGDAIDAVEGIEVDELDVFWNRRIRAGEAVIAPPVRSRKPDPSPAA